MLTQMVARIFQVDARVLLGYFRWKLGGLLASYWGCIMCIGALHTCRFSNIILSRA